MPGLALAGAGLGIVMVAASAAIISGAPPQRAGMASSLESVSYELGSLAARHRPGNHPDRRLHQHDPPPRNRPRPSRRQHRRSPRRSRPPSRRPGLDLLNAAASAFDNGYTLALAITTIALAAGSAFTYRYLTRQPTARAQQAQKGPRTRTVPVPQGSRAPQEVVMTVHISSKPADEVSRLPAAAWLVLGIVLVADIMDLLDATITTIAAPTISSSLHGGPGLIKWLGASYALALGVLLVTGGRLGDKYGRRRTFLIGIAASPRPRWPAA